eukprot:TRINITY_DN12666_c0_g1_i2.p1 TRINITY_DN12666_c0_g1~~TRINITY_DN12666_c0_g1_i2.p1  ORF type:complete len:171 (+),score=58.94 TRINITY_DN12666_c0_g1_i2:60-572(+)
MASASPDSRGGAGRRAAALVGTAVAAVVVCSYLWQQRRRRKDVPPLVEVETPTAAKTEEELEADAQALEDGLRAMGMSSAPMDPAAAAAASAAAARRAQAVADRVGNVDDVDADDMVIIERVSPEEEERRYFANMAGGDIFGMGLGDFEAAAAPEAAAPAKARPVVGYEQ